ncbi:MAG: NYN domain-containing protein, partial [Acidimicrobiales bacterium]|nr:NYN domain-containing protein [Acidimicrobiales bacterium]
GRGGRGQVGGAHSRTLSGIGGTPARACDAVGMRTDDNEERIGLFLDYENLAIGARQDLGMKRFDFGPIARAMAERGRVVYRRAYADWSDFDEDRRHLTRHQVELVEIPQRMGTSRKNSADIKMVVDALELAFEREHVTTIVICTGDSDFTPLVQKLRELDRRVIGIGVRDSTSKLLPPACDEFIYYDRLEGVEASIAAGRAPKAAVTPEADDEAPIEAPPLEELVISTLAGMQGSNEDVRASTLKRAITRIDPTFSEADHGFRGFTELLRHLADRKVVELSGAKRDPEVDLVTGDGPAQVAFDLLVAAVADKAGKKGAALSGLKTEITRRDGGFNERALGYGGFLQFCKAAAARDLVAMEWDDKRGDYLLSPAD